MTANDHDARSIQIEACLNANLDLHKSHDGRADAINPWVRLYPENAHARVKSQGTREYGAQAHSLLLMDVPVAVKDVIEVAGYPVTASSKRLSSQNVNRSSSVWRKLESEGAFMLGHTHTHEFAAGSTTDQCGNPWDLSRSAGGSSGGSAAAVAAGLVPVSLGTDTAGSLRIPAALCGVSTFKPTFGLLPNDGVIPLAKSFDTIGPVSTYLRDCRTVMQALIGRRNCGSEIPSSMQRKSLSGKRIAIADRTVPVTAEPEVSHNVRRAVDLLETLGAEIIELDLPIEIQTHTELMADYFKILYTDIWDYHRLLKQNNKPYQADVAELVAVAEKNCVDANAYGLLHHKRRQVKRALDRWFAQYNVTAIIEPTTPITAPPRTSRYIPNPAAMSLASYTATWNYTGSPVASMPCGLSEQSELPVGISLIGSSRSDSKLLRIGETLQSIMPPVVAKGHKVNDTK